MKMKIFISIIIAIVAIMMIAKHNKIGKQKKDIEEPVNPIDINPEYVDYVLKMDDIVTYLRSLQLTKGEDTPFICSLGVKNQYTSMIKGLEKIVIPADRQAILVAVYNEPKEELRGVKVIFATDIDESIKKPLSESKVGLVVLS